MSFRTRLTAFFVLIVVVPMIAVGFLVLRLISDSEQGKADARANGVLTAAVGLYQTESDVASSDAQTIARDLSPRLVGGAVLPQALRAHVATLASQAGLVRVTVTTGSRTLADVGDPTAIAPGSATIAGRPMTVTVSELTAGQYARELAAPGVGGRRTHELTPACRHRRRRQQPVRCRRVAASRSGGPAIARLARPCPGLAAPR